MEFTVKLYAMIFAKDGLVFDVLKDTLWLFDYYWRWSHLSYFNHVSNDLLILWSLAWLHEADQDPSPQDGRHNAGQRQQCQSAVDGGADEDSD